MNIDIQLPGVRLCVVEADNIAVAESGPQLLHEMDALCARLRQQFTLESLAAAESIISVRAMFRDWGVDPSKYRPSSEALLRRVIQGKGLYHVSNVVDLTNLSSVEAGWPYGVYSRSQISPPVTLRLGAPGECYEGIGRRVWHLTDRPVLADAAGPFGSPISDSTRTQIAEGVTDVLAVIYAPTSTSAPVLEQAANRQAARLAAFAGASQTRMYILG
ncbi:MAG TPA: phenylalanine--tRNA ligase beta subunit-related protein [Candidatus Acidoferrales bacterium]|nr:phenylalanine--tRNA ligase beta subunit-related protein [Candidatus Acidoferrales bacterium]